MRKKAIAIIIISILSVSVPVSANNVQQMEVVEGDGMIPRIDGLIWKYKYENGKTYKCLYNVKTGKYVGEWILVG